MNAAIISAERINKIMAQTNDKHADFGKRLASLRKQKKMSQTVLATQLGVTQRVVTYYENESARPPAHLLQKIAAVFGKSVDELLGEQEVEVAAPPLPDKRLLKKVQAIEKLSAPDQKQVFQLIKRLTP